MRLRLARLVLFLLTGGTTCAAALVAWTQPTAFPPGAATLWAFSLLPAAVALVALVATFAPLDAPGSTPRWVAPLAGAAFGVAGAGLVLFPAAFTWLALPCLLYGLTLVRLAAAVAGGGAASSVAPAPPAQPAAGTERSARSARPGASAEAAPPPEPVNGPSRSEGPHPRGSARSARPRATGHARVLLAACAAVGVAWALAVRPGEGGARPAATFEADVAPVVSRPATVLTTRRIVRHAGLVEVTGNQVGVKVILTRPRVVARVRELTVVVEPCLLLEEATLDGFLSVPPLNGYRLEPGGPATVELAEGRDTAWVSVRYGRAEPRLGALTGRLPGALRPSVPELTARLDVEVDLERGRVTLDATTRLLTPATVRRSTLGWVRLLQVEHPRLRLGLNGGVAVDLEPEDALPPTTDRLLVSEGEVARLVVARGGEGPYQTETVGPFEGWLELATPTGAIDPARPERLVVVLPDWAPQASLAPSRSAGFGLLENALTAWREGGGVNVVWDLASTRLGDAPLSTTLPAGTYRNRVTLVRPAPDAETDGLGRAEARRLTRP